jgi:imidazolonepropionase-like amidohydrolase
MRFAYFFSTLLFLTVAVKGESDALFVKNANLIDGTGKAARPGVHLLIENGAITAVDRELSPPPEARVIDATGKFVVPGLIDAHVHLDAPMVFQITPEEKKEILEQIPRAFLFNGVTTVLNVGSDAEWIWEQRAAQREGRLLAPRIYAMGRGLTPEGGWGSRHGGGLTEPEDARSIALEYASKDTDGLKIMIEDGLGASGTYTVMPQDILQAIAAVAHEKNLPIYVHAINIDEFKIALPLEPRAIMHGLEDPIPEGDPLLEQLVDNDIAVVPTISLFEAFLRFDEGPKGWEDPVLKGSVPLFLLTRMKTPEYRKIEKERFLEVARMDAYAWAEEKIPIIKENVRKMHRAGVRIAVGTDAGGPVGYNFQGYNTPWELKLLVECGFSPMEALVAATRRAAEVIGVQDQLGTLEPGKRGDLLILEANPLEDIGNIRKITMVIQDGKPYRRAELAYQRKQ